MDPKLPRGYLSESQLVHRMSIGDNFVAHVTEQRSPSEAESEKGCLEHSGEKGITQLVLLYFAPFRPVFFGFFYFETLLLVW